MQQNHSDREPRIEAVQPEKQPVQVVHQGASSVDPLVPSFGADRPDPAMLEAFTDPHSQPKSTFQPQAMLVNRIHREENLVKQINVGNPGLRMTTSENAPLEERIRELQDRHAQVVAAAITASLKEASGLEVTGALVGGREQYSRFSEDKFHFEGMELKTQSSGTEATVWDVSLDGERGADWYEIIASTKQGPREEHSTQLGGKSESPLDIAERAEKFVRSLPELHKEYLEDS